MTLQEAHDCVASKIKCVDCKYDQYEGNCMQEALTIAAGAINYLMIGQKLSKEMEEKNNG